jgi:hypothetical protein
VTAKHCHNAYCCQLAALAPCVHPALLPLLLLLLHANLAVNSTTPAPSGLQDNIVIGSQITTAPDPMRVLFLPHVQYQRFCDDATLKDAVVAHCRIKDVQNFKTPKMKQQVMKNIGLWKKGRWFILTPYPTILCLSTLWLRCCG